MLPKKSSLFFLFLLLVVCFCPIVCADEGWVTGDWLYVYKDGDVIHLATLGSESSGFANFTYGSLGAFSEGMGALFLVNCSIDAQKQFWSLGNTKNFYVAIAYRHGADSVWSSLWVANTENLVGGGQAAKMGDMTYPYSVSNFDRENACFLLQMLRINSTAVCCYGYVYYADTTAQGAMSGAGGGADMAYLYNSAIFAFNQTFVVPLSFWDDVTCDVYVGHDGSGLVNATIAMSDFGYMTPLDTDYSDARISQQNNYGIFESLVAFGSLFGALFSIAGTLIHAAPLLLFGFGISMAFACISTLSVEPLRKFAEFIWGLVAGVVSAVTGIWGAIKDAIQWW